MVANVVRNEKRERGNIQIKEHVKTNRDRKYTSHKNIQNKIKVQTKKSPGVCRNKT